MPGERGTRASWAGLLERAETIRLPDERLSRVEVWRTNVEPSDQLADLADIVLDAEERRRAATFVRPADRREYVTAHLLLRGLLARQLGCSPEQLRLRRAPCPGCGGPHGRPELESPAGTGAGARTQLHFSLSHAGGIVLVALADRPVGVDVEAWPVETTVSAVAPTLPVAERAAIAAASPRNRPAAFARAWARLEAYLKAVGTGIAVDLSRVDLLAAQASGWVIEDLPPADGLAAAVALAPPAWGEPRSEERLLVLDPRRQRDREHGGDEGETQHAQGRKT
jgi:4'-phosphopantetheinyl transferase